MPVFVEKAAFDNRPRGSRMASNLQMMALGPAKQSTRKELMFALSIQLKGRHAREEHSFTYSFYPLLREDLPEIVKMMAAYTNQKPIDEMERIKEILVRFTDGNEPARSL